MSRSAPSASRRALALLIMTLAACALVPAAANAKLTVKSVKIVKATGGVGSITLSGSVTTSAKSKSVAVALKAVSGKLPAQKKSVKAKSKKAAKTLKFSVTFATAFVGEVAVTATALKRSSKAVKVTVLAPPTGGGNPGGNGDPNPPSAGDPPPAAEALGLTSIETVSGLTCGMIGDSAYCGGINGTFNPTGANAGAATVAGLAKVGGDLASGVVNAVDAGEEFACAIKGGTEVYCWGRNYEGQLGIGSDSPGDEFNEFPVKALLPAGTVSQLSVGDSHACAIVAGAVYCWGYASHGQVGNGATTGYVLSPVAVAGMTGVTRVVAHDGMTCAIKSSGVYCWGYNKNNRFGPGKTEGADYATPEQVLSTGLPSGTVVADIAMGDSNSCALTSTGAMYCWGAGPYGELGIGSGSVAEGTPVTPIGMDSGVTSISLSFYHVCAVKNGAAYCWGNDWETQLGIGGGASQRTEPATVTGLGSGVLSISAGTWNTCAVMVATSGYCWGKGGAQLVSGQTTSVDQSTPAAIIKIIFA